MNGAFAPSERSLAGRPSKSRCVLIAVILLGSVGLAGCKSKAPGGAADAASAPSGSLGPPVAPPAPMRGMLWIPGGALIAGTAPDAYPRLADQEMLGEQLILHGFYIDVFPFPNEEGAIPLTAASQPDAAAHCEEKGKRLCSELEWERACKGPTNTTYEYGNVYRAERCGTGASSAMRPTGFLAGCRSEFGVRDMHGGVWEWTDSPWGRGSDRALIALRGGNAAQGELVGRCANAIGRSADTKAANIGFRCCAGPRNDDEVALEVARGEKLDARASMNKELASAALALLPEEAKTDLGGQKGFHFEREWVWRPIGNEEIHVLSGCSGLAVKPACGILLVRATLTAPQVLAWVSSGYWAPMLYMDNDPRDLWLFGGDELGQFRRQVGYVWGHVSVGPKERKVPRPKKKKKKP
ncbi:MAG: formylglycine-generating enzyme family protein [Myxococcales bacterium]|nr:formylglycine-generating enzyme family protein [Myxococcales bacterium]